VESTPAPKLPSICINDNVDLFLGMSDLRDLVIEPTRNFCEENNKLQTISSFAGAIELDIRYCSPTKYVMWRCPLLQPPAVTRTRC
jgi:hypothetical protein